MDISNIGQNLPITAVQNGKKLSSEAADQTSNVNKNTEISTRKVDMRNISLNEINELIKSGADGLLDFLPFPSAGLNVYKLGDSSYVESWMSEKIDYLGQVENSIAFEKSIGKPTDFLEKVLANLNKLNGAFFPSKVDITA